MTELSTALMDDLVRFGLHLLYAIIFIAVGLKAARWLSSRIKRMRLMQRIDPSVASFISTSSLLALRVLVLVIAALIIGVPGSAFITLFGSVGDRAQLRREELGTTSGKLADFTVVTSDDPGFEDPQKIADEIASYVKAAGGEYVVIPDREEAVAYAVSILQEGDFLLCCGKGHERFMKVRGKKEPFNEEECIEEALKKRGIDL